MSALARLTTDQFARAREAGIPDEGPRISRQLASKVGPMFARGLVYKRRFREAAGVPLVGRGVTISNPQMIRTGTGLLVEDNAEIQGLSVDGIRFGHDVSIGRGAMIRPSSYYSRSIGVGLAIGDRSSIGPQCYIGCSGGIDIREDVMLAPGVRLFSENHDFAGVGSIKDLGVTRAPILIDNGAWVASGVTITAGVTIGGGAVIAAGAVVTRDVEPGAIMAGVPARKIGQRS